MEQLSLASASIQSARDADDCEIDALVARLDLEENGLKERLNELSQKKSDASDGPEVSGNDKIKVNAGGQIITAKRSTLTQLKGTRFEALFSGRWDKKLQRDSEGRIFLDVNPIGFRAIVDHLHERAISPDDDPPGPPRVNDEHQLILIHQLELFGLHQLIMPESNTIKTLEEANCLHDWLEEDGSDGEFTLLYRGSRDGFTSDAFHSKCDNKGPTVTIIQTEDFTFGGYASESWENTSLLAPVQAEKSFLFALSGLDIPSPSKMKLKGAKAHAIYHGPDGPIFGGAFGFGGAFCTGHDLKVKLGRTDEGQFVSPNVGCAYESAPPGKMSKRDPGAQSTSFKIEDMEVYQLSERTPQAAGTSPKTQLAKALPVKKFSEGVNAAINARQELLLKAEVDIIDQEDSFEDELGFISTFASGDARDIVKLDVSGVVMTTKRSTLQAVEDSLLAQQFLLEAKMAEQGCKRPEEWTPGDVASWVENTEDIPKEAAIAFEENDITGRELLSMNMEGLKMIGIKRAGTMCLLLEEIQGLKEANQNTVTLIEHSPYCFGKILDQLRLKQLHNQRLAKEPALPTVRDEERDRFERVVRYYFPGEGSKVILG